MHGRHLGEELAVGHVGAAVEEHVGAAGQDRAVGAQPGGQVDDHALASTVGRQEFFAAGEDESDRTTGGSGERSDVGFVVEAALAAEATAEVRHDDAHLVRWQLERLADPGASSERHLGRGPDRDLVALPLRDHAARFDRCRVARVGDVAAAHDDVGVGHRRDSITLADGAEAGDVSAPLHTVSGVVALPVRVHEWRAFGERGFEVGDRGQRLVVDDDRSRGGTCLFKRGCGDRGHDIAVVANGVFGEQAPVGGAVGVANVGHVVCRQDRHDARQGRRGRRVDRSNRRVRVLGIDERCVEHAGEGEVGGVATRAGDLVGPVGPIEARQVCRVDHFRQHGCRRGRSHRCEL